MCKEGIIKKGFLLLWFISSALFSVEGFQTDIAVEIALPNETTPLSTVLTLDKVNTGVIEVLVKGKKPQMDIAFIYPAGYGTVFSIHGLYANYDNTIIITGIDDGIDITKNIKTESIPVRNASVKIDALATPDIFNQDLYFFNSGNTIAAVDRMGDIRYVQDVGTRRAYHIHSIFFDKTQNAILIKDDRGIYDLLGNALLDFEEFQIHHDSAKKNDNYIVLSYSKLGYEDRIMEITPTGDIVIDKTLGSLFRAITVQKDLALLNQIIYDDTNVYIEDGKKTKKDWAHANSLVYDNSTDILYVSLRNQGIVAIDYSEWTLLWWMADNNLDTNHPGVPNKGMNFLDIPSLEAYRVKGDGQTDGPKNQHALLLRRNGNIAMFDNQGDEKTNPKGSRYVEYSIRGELGNWTATKVREYRDASLYSNYISDIDLTGDEHQNILLAYGSPKKIIEVDANNKVLFEMDLHLFTGSFSYRIAKMPLYPYADFRKKYTIDQNEKNGL